MLVTPTFCFVLVGHDLCFARATLTGSAALAARNNSSFDFFAEFRPGVVFGLAVVGVFAACSLLRSSL